MAKTSKPLIPSVTPERSGPNLTRDRGGASSFSTKYKIQELSYPEDIYSPEGPYGGNFVVFYINVAEDSKILKDEIQSSINAELPQEYRMRGDNIGIGASGNEAVAGAAVGGAVAGAGVSAIGKIISGAGKGGFGAAVKDVGGDAAKAGAAAGLAAGVVNNMAGGKMARQQKRLEKAIALHIPNQLSIRYSMQWADEETMLYQAAITENREIAAAMGKQKPATKEESSNAKALATSLALSKTPGMGGALSSASGLAANPKKEQIFKNVNHREFTFDYTFAPRSSTEARKVLNIIETFKLHMHPEYKDTNNFIFIYPSEFDIFYYQGTKENLNIHRHTSCVLKDMTVNYTPNGMFNTFDDGMPTQINISLSFLELAILTKQQIVDKF
jgi:hypothetical protein